MSATADRARARDTLRGTQERQGPVAQRVFKTRQAA
jgi:hypothetical protein